MELKVRLCFFVFALTTFMLFTVQAQDRLLVISGGAIVDVVNGRILDNTLIFIRGSRIERITGGGELDIPPDAEVIEAHGKYLIPGLIDIHTHYRDWVPELFVNHGVTSVRDNANEITWITSVKRAQERGLLDLQGFRWYSRSGPRVFVAGVMNTYPNGKSHHYQAKSLDDARKAVDWMLAAGVDGGFKCHDGTSLEMVKAICEKAHSRGAKVTAHLTKGIMVREGVLAGVDGIEHSYYEKFEQPESEAMETIRLMIRRGVYWTPTLLEQWKGEIIGIPPEDAAHVRGVLADPGTKYFPETWRKILEVVYPTGGKTPAQEGEELQRFQYITRLLKAYSDGGGKLLAGSDSAAYFLSGFSLHEEMAVFVDHVGLTPLQALRTATLNAAEFLGVTDLGRIEVGARADIVILDANPFDNIKNTRKISTVIQNGKVIPTSYHANFVPLLPRPVMPFSPVFSGEELLENPSDR